MREMTRRLGSVLISIFFAIMLVSASVAAYRTLASMASIEQGSDPGWWVSGGLDDLKVVSVRKDGPAARAIEQGDRILSINGADVLDTRQLSSIFRRIPPGSTYEIVIEREGKPVLLRLGTVDVSRGVRILLPLATLLIPAIFLFSGLALFALKPDDKQSRLIALMFGTSSGLFVSGSFPELTGALRFVVFSSAVLSTFFWPIFLHFFLIFPTPREALSPLLRRFPRFEYLLYLPHVLLTLPYSLVWGIYRTQEPEALAGFMSSYRWIAYLAAGLPVLYVFAGLLSLLVNYDRASRLLRRKMRVVVAGSIGGLLPMLMLFALGLFFSERISESVLLWLAVVAVSAFALFPLSFLYAIARYQVIPVRLILRRGVRYVFVSRGSIVLELVAVAVVLTLLLEFVFVRFRLSSVQVGLLSGVVSVLVWQVSRQLHHRVIAPLIDRSFFRQAYNAQQILAELGQALRGMTNVDESTCALICERTRAALHAENVSLFLLDAIGRDYHCAVQAQHSEEADEELISRPALSLAVDGPLVRRLTESFRPVRVDFEDPKSWVGTIVAGSAFSREGIDRDAALLEELRSALLLPIATKEHLIGVMSLGPRLGDLPYSREDEHLLSAVTWQLAYAIENANLIRQRADEDRLQREIEFAAEVQRRLFPQNAPSVRTLDLSGVCHPARGVGGDYYDFLVLDEGHIGIAVADVSGKGMSAALLMSTVQASLRTQASLTWGRIPELVTSMNRLLCESTDMSHYATFFYAEYDETARRLTYVNAGHNPPMLFRNGLRPGSSVDGMNGGRDGDGYGTVAAIESVTLLERGGPVIGLLSDCSYEHEALEMATGDVLVAFTDGVSEARSPEDEEFGEERLALLVSENLELEAEQIREKIVSEVRSWCRGASLQDDLTLVIVKVTC